MPAAVTTAFSAPAGSGIIDMPGVVRALQDGDTEGHSAGLTFLADYAAELPREVEDLRLAYEDSIAAFTPREATRARLGEGEAPADPLERRQTSNASDRGRRPAV